MATIFPRPRSDRIRVEFDKTQQAVELSKTGSQEAAASRAIPPDSDRGQGSGVQ